MTTHSEPTVDPEPDQDPRLLPPPPPGCTAPRIQLLRRPATEPARVPTPRLVPRTAGHQRTPIFVVRPAHEYAASSAPAAAAPCLQIPRVEAWYPPPIPPREIWVPVWPSPQPQQYRPAPPPLPARAPEDLEEANWDEVPNGPSPLPPELTEALLPAPANATVVEFWQPRGAGRQSNRAAIRWPNRTTPPTTWVAPAATPPA